MSNVTEAAIETVAGLTQDLSPTKGICAWLNGFHVYDADRARPGVETDHYCAHVRSDLRQCLLYANAGRDGKKALLIGVEYMIPRARFETLPEAEKKYWHSHQFEVKSGMLILPKPAGVPAAVWEVAERRELAEVVDWYGKTYHFIETDKGHDLPLGEPKLMMAYTAMHETEPTQQAWRDRDERYGVSSDEKRRQREDIELPPLAQGADTGLARS